MKHEHLSHPEVINRLKRANGHLTKIIDMIEQGRPCVEIAQQMQAVYAAIGNAKTLFVHDHIDGCIEQADNTSPSATKKTIQELKDITKYL